MNGLPEWPAYETLRDIYMELGDVITARKNLSKDKLDIIETLL